MKKPDGVGHPDGFPIVAIGASAGGLEACSRFLNALPTGMDMAFILIQHLDPTHESMLVELLTAHTTLKVLQPSDGQLIERGHFCVIPPGTELSVRDGRIWLEKLTTRRGVRMPFDVLLQSLATHSGHDAVCIVLSGTGTDGSAGLAAIKANGGFVIAQDPAEADYAGMPRSAIETGDVDLVLSASQIPDALRTYCERLAQPEELLARERAVAAMHQPTPDAAPDELPTIDELSAIIALLRQQSAHDFTHYKSGTLRRRIESRMARAAIAHDDMAGYLALLQRDPRELELLASDLLIKVTSFFRDPHVFELLADTIIPDLLRTHRSGEPLRIWVAGCSTGEETYSIAMLFREQITALHLDVKLQMFASDADPEAVASAREGLYVAATTANVSPERLSRFFSQDEHGYRVIGELRVCVVFTVQDVLTDPPFSRLDMVSCRNLLIYLRPEAQAVVIARFHFALRDGGVLMLGNAETIEKFSGQFEPISKPCRLYRRVGQSKLGAIGSVSRSAALARSSVGPPPSQIAKRPVAYADLCRRLVLEHYAPAAVLINRTLECLYSLGPIDTYLQVVAGTPMHDVLAMAREGVKPKLRAAVKRAFEDNTRVEVTGRATNRNGAAQAFKLSVHPVHCDGTELLLVCFTDEPKQGRSVVTSAAPSEQSRVAELERELEMTRSDLQDAVRNLDTSGEEQRIINEEALSVNEEFQSTNEELLTSKEELQSLNEELTALNSQLQEALERQRTTSNDLQNVLNSTDVATIFLDTNLNIRFFTPATRSLFNVIASDLGRALGDLKSLAADDTLLTDAQTVLRTSVPIEVEIEAGHGAWFTRRVLPYRTHNNGVEGVVITFADITERRRTAEALGLAKRQAELASVAKSRFLATASHDLRQPLQTLTLVQALLANTVHDPDAQALIARFDATLGGMSGMLNALLDINAIEAGTVRAELVAFPIDDLLERMRDEFAYHAQAKKLSLRVVSCGLSIVSDPRLLEQMVRNLLSNALKYTRHGKVLIGCRRRKAVLNIEVWDTGIGIPAGELRAIFDEYHQLDHGPRERNRGLGLGLSIVQRLSHLLNHRVTVRSRLGRGSVFTIEVELASNERETLAKRELSDAASVGAETGARTGTILVVEDDPEVRELLQLVLTSAGHRAITASDGAEALGLVTHETVRPDLILADYDLPNGMNGLQVTSHLRKKFQREIPTIVLSGDISADTLRDIALQECVQLNKPVGVAELAQAIQQLLPAARSHATPSAGIASIPKSPVIFIVDDDAHVRDSLRSVLEATGRTAEDFASCEEFLEAYRPGRAGCLLIDAYLPGMNGLELLQWLRNAGHQLPSIMITGNSDVSMAVRAMKAGALDFIEKPVAPAELLGSIDRALEQSRDAATLSAWQQFASSQVATLTSRQHQIMKLVLDGWPSKNIAAELGISQRTVENHRASIMQKTGTSSLPALARLAVAADEHAGTTN